MLLANICFVVGFVMALLSLGMTLLCDGRAYNIFYYLFLISFLITEASIFAISFIGG